MKGHIRLGRVAGVEIALHFSWFLIALLLTLSLGASFRDGETALARNPVVLWTAALATGLLFFATLVLHELAHALAARAGGLPVRSVTLFALGGVSHMEGEPDRPGTEFWVGISGPITSVIIGVACLSLARAAGWSGTAEPRTAATAILTWLGGINIVLAVFNMLPGYPLDGGRVLRAILWKISGDRGRATRQAAAVGQGVAILLVAFGLLQFFQGAGISGMWLAFIGWFLLMAAAGSSRAVEVAETLSGVKVEDAMSTDCARVRPDRGLADFVEHELMLTGRRCFVVGDDQGHVAGLLTIHEVRGIPRDRWAQMTVGDVMRPLDRMRTIGRTRTLGESLELMSREDIHQLPVLEEGRLLGVLTRGDVLRVLQARQELAA